MENETPSAAIGPYQILQKLGRGGMGEVLLAKDPHCSRKVAIKRVRSDLVSHEIIRNRFLKEAKVTASLFHPSIIPVYSIHQSTDELYYVMPYVEGETLKSLLREAISNEKRGNITLPLTSALKIFTSICQAVSYCHSQGILHRDLKPENVLVAKFGQVLIFDWGLAARIDERDPPSNDLPDMPIEDEAMTLPGKVLGTLAYLPPERFDGRASDTSTDIYSLGVILYQLLTLKMPFHRVSIKEYKKLKKFETLIDPIEAAPYRDIPQKLSMITKKCLDPNPKERYATVTDLLRDLERFNAGLPDWIYATHLDVANPQDWEIQENVSLSKLIAITRSTEIMQWFMLMISKLSFSGNKRVEMKIELKKDSSGICILFNIPEPKERCGLEDGYQIWLGSKNNPGIKLCRSHVTVFEIADHYLEIAMTYFIEIEKVDQKVTVVLNGVPLIAYTDSLPIVGTHVGFLCEDLEFNLQSCKVFVGSQNAMVGCLSVPDAFLAAKRFDEALLEYDRISESLAGRTEERGATFRAGITLIEMAKANPSLSNKYFDEAHAKFEKLHQTPNEPMEYLGQSLIYQNKQDLDEELKCLELGVLKCKKHPLNHLLEERVIFRLHESAKSDRKGVFSFALITLRHLQHRLGDRETHALIHTLLSNAEKPPFLDSENRFPDLPTKYRHMAAELAFWLDKPLVLKDLLSNEKCDSLRETFQYLIVSLGHQKFPFLPLHVALEKKIDSRHIFFLIDRKLTRRDAHTLLPILEKMEKSELDSETRRKLDFYLLWQSLFMRDYHKGKEILANYSREANEQCSSPFFMLHGIQLAGTLGLGHALKHFEKTLDHAYPSIFSLLAHSLKNPSAFATNWEKEAFSWEKISLYRHSLLFYHCLGRKAKVLSFERKLKKTGFLSIVN